MIKIGRFFRETVEKKLKEDIEKSGGIFVFQYSGLSSVQMTLLRSCVREARGRVFVSKNSILRRALQGANLQGLDGFVDGPTAVVFFAEDICLISRAIIKFIKENPSLNLGAAFYQNRILSKKEIEDISNLPSKETLRAQAVMLLKFPITNLVYTLQGNLNKLAVILNQIKDKKDK